MFYLILGVLLGVLVDRIYLAYKVMKSEDDGNPNNDV